MGRTTILLCLLVACAMQRLTYAAAPLSQPYVWNNVAILGGGFVSGIITHPAQKGLIYARTDIGGAYRWDDSGKRWIALTDWCTGETWNYTGIESLAIDPKDPNRVYLAAGTYTNEWAGKGAILRSSDCGYTWQKTDLPFKNGGNEEGRNAGERLAVDPFDGNVLLLGTRNEGLWRSDDRGVTWNRVESFPIKTRTNGVGLVLVVFDTKRRGTIYVGVSGASPNLYRSTDGGNNWQPLAALSALARMLPNHAAIAQDGSLYVTCANAPGPNGMTDGAAWSFTPGNGRWTDISPIKPSDQDQFGYAGVTIDAHKQQTIIVSTMDRWSKKDNLFRSTDGGKSWQSLLDHANFDHSTAPYTKRLTPHWTADVEIDPFDSDHLLFVTGYGIWGTHDGGSHWTFDNQGLEECVVNDLVSPPGEALVLSAMWDLDGFRHVALDSSPPDGNFRPSYGRCTSIDFAQRKPQMIVRVYGGETSTHGSYSNDNGASWTAFPTAPPGKGDGTVAVSADGQTILWAQENAPTVFSTDLGKTWSRSAGIDKAVTVISDRADANRFYAFDAKAGTVHVTIDAGRHFVRSPAALPKGEGSIRAVPGTAGDIWATTSSGLYRSTDSGATFARVGDFQPAYRVGFGKAAPGQSYPALYVIGKVGGVYGIYRSDDAGASWLRINDDQHQFASINAITGDPRVFGRVYLGSASRGVIYGDPAAKESK